MYNFRTLHYAKLYHAIDQKYLIYLSTNIYIYDKIKKNIFKNFD